MSNGQDDVTNFNHAERAAAERAAHEQAARAERLAALFLAALISTNNDMDMNHEVKIALSYAENLMRRIDMEYEW